MDTERIETNDERARRVIRGLASRNMTGYYVQTREEALAKALELIPEGSSVTMGGSMSVCEIGLLDAIRNGNYNFCDRNRVADPREAELFAYTADVFLGSVNALLESGSLLNVDGNANRVSAYAYGPKKLVLIVGMNKVVKDFDEGMKRTRNVAAPKNAKRLGCKTPCAQTGSCVSCQRPDTLCCQVLITRYERRKDRIHVILVNESLGF